MNLDTEEESSPQQVPLLQQAPLTEPNPHFVEIQGESKESDRNIGNPDNEASVDLSPSSKDNCTLDLDLEIECHSEPVIPWPTPFKSGNASNAASAIDNSTLPVSLETKNGSSAPTIVCSPEKMATLKQIPEMGVVCTMPTEQPTNLSGSSRLPPWRFPSPILKAPTSTPIRVAASTINTFKPTNNGLALTQSRLLPILPVNRLLPGSQPFIVTSSNNNNLTFTSSPNAVTSTNTGISNIQLLKVGSQNSALGYQVTTTGQTSPSSKNRNLPTPWSSGTPLVDLANLQSPAPITQTEQNKTSPLKTAIRDIFAHVVAPKGSFHFVKKLLPYDESVKIDSVNEGKVSNNPSETGVANKTIVSMAPVSTTAQYPAIVSSSMSILNSTDKGSVRCSPSTTCSGQPIEERLQGISTVISYSGPSPSSQVGPKVVNSLIPLQSQTKIDESLRLSNSFNLVEVTNNPSVTGVEKKFVVCPTLPVSPSSADYSSLVSYSMNIVNLTPGCITSPSTSQGGQPIDGTLRGTAAVRHQPYSGEPSSCQVGPRVVNIPLQQSRADQSLFNNVNMSLMNVSSTSLNSKNDPPTKKRKKKDKSRKVKKARSDNDSVLTIDRAFSLAENQTEHQIGGIRNCEASSHEPVVQWHHPCTDPVEHQHRVDVDPMVAEELDATVEPEDNHTMASLPFTCHSPMKINLSAISSQCISLSGQNETDERATSPARPEACSSGLGTTEGKDTIGPIKPAVHGDYRSTDDDDIKEIPPQAKAKLRSQDACSLQLVKRIPVKKYLDVLIDSIHSSSETVLHGNPSLDTESTIKTGSSSDSECSEAPSTSTSYQAKAKSKITIRSAFGISEQESSGQHIPGDPVDDEPCASRNPSSSTKPRQTNDSPGKCAYPNRTLNWNANHIRKIQLNLKRRFKLREQGQIKSPSKGPSKSQKPNDCSNSTTGSKQCNNDDVLSSSGCKMQKDSLLSDVVSNVLHDCIIRKAIQDCYVKKEPPSIQIILDACSASGLHFTKKNLEPYLKAIGFNWVDCHSGRLLVEEPRFTAKRIEYLDQLEAHSDKNLVYIFVSDLLARPAGWFTYRYSAMEHMDSKKLPSYVVMHAMDNTSLIYGSLRVLKLDQYKVDTDQIEYWLKNIVLTKVPKGSVVILGDGIFELTEEKAVRPHVGCSKAEILSWLKSHGVVSVNPDLPKAMLISKAYDVRVPQTSIFDRTIRQSGFEIIFVPKHHKDLNPIEFLWQDILDKLKKSPEDKINSYMDVVTFVEREFLSCSQEVTSVASLLVRKFEESYRDFDHCFDELFDSMATPVDSVATPVDSMATPVDSMATPVDSMATPVNSLATPVDSVVDHDGDDLKEPPARTCKPSRPVTTTICPVCRTPAKMIGFRCMKCKSFWRSLVRKYQRGLKRLLPVCKMDSHASTKPPTCNGCRRNQYELALLKTYPDQALPLPPVTSKGKKHSRTLPFKTYPETSKAPL